MISATLNPTSVTLLERLRRPPAEAQEAWRRFTNLYTPLLFAWARRLGRSGDKAADLVQEVFLQLVRTLPFYTIERHRPFRRWLCTVVRNKHFQLYRIEWPHDQERADEAERVIDDDTVAAWVEEDYRKHLVGRALQVVQKDFSPATWQAFQQYVIEEKPVEVVAAALGVSENAVYRAKSRVLQRLREELDGMLD
jgi:RNA polymerase sigma-70 factor (ECF subfamily)